MVTVETLQAPIALRERYAGLLYGALAADSLALAPHWIYDQDELAQRFGSVTDLQKPPTGGYHSGKELGDQTHYGDQSLVLMQSLADCGGNFVMEDFVAKWREFAEDSPAYHDHATHDTLAQLQKGLGLTKAGSASHELGGAARLAPLLLALRHEDDPVILAAARAQTALTHANPAVMEAAEFIVRTHFLLLRGVTIPSALQAALGFQYKVLPSELAWQHAQEVRHLSTRAAVKELGQSCDLDSALSAVLLLLLHHGDNLEKALEENVRAGGDSAARGMMLGTLLGAAHGRRAIPERWIGPLRARSRVESFLQLLELGGEQPND